MGNDGVMISDGEKAVVLDGLQRGIGWVDLPLSESLAIEAGEEPYDQIVVATISHNHTDHYSSTSVRRYRASNAVVRGVAPPQVRPLLLASKCPPSFLNNCRV